MKDQFLFQYKHHMKNQKWINDSIFLLCTFTKKVFANATTDSSLQCKLPTRILSKHPIIAWEFPVCFLFKDVCSLSWIYQLFSFPVRESWDETAAVCVCMCMCVCVRDRVTVSQASHIRLTCLLTFSLATFDLNVFQTHPWTGNRLPTEQIMLDRASCKLFRF